MRKQTADQFLELPEDLRKKLQLELPRGEITQKESIHSSSIVELVKQAKEFAKKWNKLIADVNFDHFVEDEYGSSSSRAQLEVAGQETDEQYHMRLMEYHVTSKRREEWERKEFDRLTTKFAK